MWCRAIEITISSVSPDPSLLLRVRYPSAIARRFFLVHRQHHKASQSASVNKNPHSDPTKATPSYIAINSARPNNETKPFDHHFNRVRKLIILLLEKPSKTITTITKIRTIITQATDRSAIQSGILVANTTTASKNENKNNSQTQTTTQTKR